LAHSKDIRWKKRHLKNEKGLIRKTSDEKRAIKNANGLIQKTSDEKRSNKKTQIDSFKRPLMKKDAPRKHKGAHIKDLRWKRRHPKKIKGLMQKTFDEKEGTPQTQKGDFK
jgi:hypothetical protein